MTRKYGRKRDFADYRDLFLPSRRKAVPLPSLVDERAFGGKIKDQGQEGSCEGHAGSETVEWQFRKYRNESPVLSPQNLYVNLLLNEGTFPQDNGAMTRTTCRVLHSQGVCEEGIEPYVAGKLISPTVAQAANSRKYKLGGYHRLAGLPDLLSVLGDPTPWPVLIGFDVYESFESQQVADTGVMPVPGPNEQILGGHVVLCLGYRMADRVAICQNSWGSSWGDKGYFTMPFDVIANANMVSDLWIIHIGEWAPKK